MDLQENARRGRMELYPDIEPFNSGFLKVSDIHTIYWEESGNPDGHGEEVDYRGVLHRDGSVLMSVTLDQLKTPELLYKSLAAKLVVGMPFKDLATVDSIFVRELPPVEDIDSRLALKRLRDISMGVITPLSEQLTKPLPNAIALVNLKELASGANKLLPEDGGEEGIEMERATEALIQLIKDHDRWVDPPTEE